MLVRPASIKTLPTELLQHIFRFIPSSSYSSTLFSCLLVSRRLYSTAHSLLYERIPIVYEDPHNHFEDLIDTIQTRNLGHFVRSLSLGEKWKKANHLLRIIVYCQIPTIFPNVHTIFLDIPDVHEEKLLGFLSGAADLHNLQDLTIYYPDLTLFPRPLKKLKYLSWSVSADSCLNHENRDTAAFTESQHRCFIFYSTISTNCPSLQSLTVGALTPEADRHRLHRNETIDTWFDYYSLPFLNMTPTLPKLTSFSWLAKREPPTYWAPLVYRLLSVQASTLQSLHYDLSGWAADAFFRQTLSSFTSLKSFSLKLLTPNNRYGSSVSLVGGGTIFVEEHQNVFANSLDQLCLSNLEEVNIHSPVAHYQAVLERRLSEHLSLAPVLKKITIKYGDEAFGKAYVFKKTDVWFFYPERLHQFLSTLPRCIEAIELDYPTAVNRGTQLEPTLDLYPEYISHLSNLKSLSVKGYHLPPQTLVLLES